MKENNHLVMRLPIEQVSAVIGTLFYRGRSDDSKIGSEKQTPQKKEKKKKKKNSPS